jgi:SET domain-containing protein
MIEVRNSPIHGSGVFALREIPRGTTIIEYTGERISWDEADRREEKKDPDDTHTMLFTVNKKVVIDATRRGSDARYINHSCWGNCNSYIEDDRVYIQSRRKILPGEELAYDYKLQMDGEKITKKLRKQYACRCGSPKCRGTLLDVPKKDPAVAAKKAASKKAAAAR